MTATMYPNHRAGALNHRVGADRPTVNYAARRAVAAVVALAVVMALALAAVAAAPLIGALVDVGSRPAAASGAVTSSVDRVHVAQPGDTLWSIAERYRGDVGHDRFVDALIGVNGGTAIQVGQAVRLP
jgi:nucleoid-associated protein YgaU